MPTITVQTVLQEQTLDVHLEHVPAMILILYILLHPSAHHGKNMYLLFARKKVPQGSNMAAKICFSTRRRQKTYENIREDPDPARRDLFSRFFSLFVKSYVRLER